MSSLKETARAVLATGAKLDNETTWAKLEEGKSLIEERRRERPTDMRLAAIEDAIVAGAIAQLKYEQLKGEVFRSIYSVPARYAKSPAEILEQLQRDRAAPVSQEPSPPTPAAAAEPPDEDPD